MTTIDISGTEVPLPGRLLRILAASIGADGLARRLELAGIRRRAYDRVRAELATYSDRELLSDLRISGAQIDELAAEEAALQVEAYVRRHPGDDTSRAGRGVELDYARG